MKRGTAVAGWVLVGLLACSAASAQLVENVESGFLPQAKPGTPAAREDEAYNEGTAALDEARYQVAMEKFAAVAEMNGRRADASLYWKAYAQNKLGRRNEALATVAELRKRFPQSRWLKDAGALEVEVRRAQREPVKPEDTTDEELKLLAIQSMMDSDDPRAVAMLENVLTSNHSPRVKERALFVLAQSDSPRAQQVIGEIARGRQHPALQRKAIHYLATNGTPQNKKTLVEIYQSASDAAVKRVVLEGFLISDAEAEMVSVARNEPDASLRRLAIQKLGAMEARGPLRQMYQASTSPEEKRNVVDALGVAEDVEFLAQIARSPSELPVRKAAIRSLGISGKEARPLLVSIYGSDANAEIKEAALDGLFVNDADDELIALARKETDPQMRRRIIEKLSVMDSPKSREFMMEILNK